MFPYPIYCTDVMKENNIYRTNDILNIPLIYYLDIYKNNYLLKEVFDCDKTDNIYKKIMISKIDKSVNIEIIQSEYNPYIKKIKVLKSEDNMYKEILSTYKNFNYEDGNKDDNEDDNEDGNKDDNENDNEDGNKDDNENDNEDGNKDGKKNKGKDRYKSHAYIDNLVNLL